MAPTIAAPANPAPVAAGAAALLVADEMTDDALELRDARIPLALEDAELAAEETDETWEEADEVVDCAMARGVRRRMTVENFIFEFGGWFGWCLDMW
jgi:hypothetical protein